MSFTKLSLAALTTLALSASSLAHADEHTIGQAGSVIVGADLNAIFDHSKVDSDGFEFTTTTIGMHPSLDFFVADGISLGGDLLLQHSTTDYDEEFAEDDTDTTYGLGVRAGYLAPLAPRFSLWLRGGVGYQSHGDDDDANGTTGFIYDGRALFLFDIVPHFFFAAGPGVTYTSIKADEGDGEASITSLGARLEIGGYW